MNPVAPRPMEVDGLPRTTTPGRGLNAIEVEGLVKRYGEVTAVDGVSFEVPHGAIFALVGPNGSGKTSTVECIPVSYTHLTLPTKRIV